MRYFSVVILILFPHLLNVFYTHQCPIKSCNTSSFFYPVFILLFKQYRKASFRGTPSAHPDWIVASVDEEVEMKFQRTI